MVVTGILVAAVVAIVVFGIALTWRARHAFVEANQVVPGVPSAAPSSWAGSHSPEAKMHRRLAEAVRAAQNNPRLEQLGLGPQTREVEQAALAIDERLVAAASLPDRHQADAVAALEPQVRELEDVVTTLVSGTTVNESKALLERVQSEADIKLQALTEARAEVERIDQQPGGDGDTTSGATGPSST